ncbi:MAG: outer membrane beta-barrel protein [Acidobacteriaceae bacterium]
MLPEKTVRGTPALAVRTRSRSPLTFVLSLCLPLLLTTVPASSLRAQQTQPGEQPQTEQPQQSPQQKQQASRQLQSRRTQSRQRRIQQIVNDTYSHKYEMYTGGMYMRFRPGPSLHNSGMGGWALGLTDYLTPRLGITGDARGYYGSSSISVNNPNNIHNASYSVFTFMAGPQYRLYGQQHFAVSAALQAGATYGYFDADTNGFPPQLVGLYPAGTVFGALASLHLDYNLSPALAIRLSPHVLIDHFGGDYDHNNGLLIGVVYRFGRH